VHNLHVMHVHKTAASIEARILWMEQLLAGPHGPHCNFKLQVADAGYTQQCWVYPSSMCCSATHAALAAAAAHMPACAGLWVRARSASHQHTTGIECKAGSTQHHSQHGSQHLAASAPGVPANAGGALFQGP
jgi:hypothetical protein